MSTNSTDTPKLLDLPIVSGWKVKHHRLFDIDPTVTDSLHVDLPTGFTVWDLCFGQDILLAEHDSGQRLIDIGWLPHGNPDGSFLIQLLGLEESTGADKRYDWMSPLVEYRTRSLFELQFELVRLMKLQLDQGML